MNGEDPSLHRLLDGESDEAERARLAALLLDDPNARMRLGGLALTEGLLGVALENELSSARSHHRIMEAVRQADQEQFVSRVRSKVRRRFWRDRLLAGAAVLAMGFAGWFALRPGVVATVVRVEVSGSTNAVAGGSLAPGARLRLDRGLVELDMAGRGRMIVEGPADLELTTPMRSVLHRGRILMRVNHAGHGYRLETPKGTVVDLGTEFGVSVDDHQAVETHVLEGEVEAIPSSGEKVLLRKDDAMRFSDTKGERFRADGGAFYTELPPVRNSEPGSIHWTLDFQDETRDAAEATDPGFANSAMELRQMDQGSLPRKTMGRFGQCLEFDGKGGYAESDYPGVGGKEPRTVCFWVKVPVDFSLREGFAMVSWGNFDHSDPGAVWQISINPLAEDGPIGRIRVGAHGGQIVGHTDLRDGQWHHIAVVLYQSSRADIGRQVLIYVDGGIEPISRRALQELDTRINGSNHGVWLGRNVTYTRSDPANKHGGFFRGCLDEVYIYNGALAPGEIRDLMARNKRSN